MPDPHDFGFLRHVAACNDARLPGGRTALRIGEAVVGWLAADVAASLAGLPEIAATAEGMRLRDGGALHAISRALSAKGMLR